MSLKGVIGMAAPIRKRRARPSQVPEILEEDAKGEISRLYDEIRDYLQAPLVNSFLRLLANYPQYLLHSWEELKPNFTESTVGAAGAIGEAAAEGIRGELQPVDHREALEEKGFHPEVIAEIRMVIDAFQRVNPKLLILVTALDEAAAGRWLEGVPFPRSGVAERGIPERFARIRIVKESCALPRVRHLFTDIRERMGARTVDSDCRALANWPDHLDVAWQDLRSRVHGVAWTHLRDRVADLGLQAAARLPSPVTLDEPAIRALGYTAEQVADIRKHLGSARHVLPGSIVNISYFRAGLRA